MQLSLRSKNKAKANYHSSFFRLHKKDKNEIEIENSRIKRIKNKRNIMINQRNLFK